MNKFTYRIVRHLSSATFLTYSKTITWYTAVDIFLSEAEKSKFAAVAKLSVGVGFAEAIAFAIMRRNDSSRIARTWRAFWIISITRSTLVAFVPGKTDFALANSRNLEMIENT